MVPYESTWFVIAPSHGGKGEGHIRVGPHEIDCPLDGMACDCHSIIACLPDGLILASGTNTEYTPVNSRRGYMANEVHRDSPNSHFSDEAVNGCKSNNFTGAAIGIFLPDNGAICAGWLILHWVDLSTIAREFVDERKGDPVCIHPHTVIRHEDHAGER